jgi:hypothetical protein
MMTSPPAATPAPASGALAGATYPGRRAAREPTTDRPPSAVPWVWAFHIPPSITMLPRVPGGVAA